MVDDLPFESRDPFECAEVASRCAVAASLAREAGRGTPHLVQNRPLTHLRTTLLVSAMCLAALPVAAADAPATVTPPAPADAPPSAPPSPAAVTNMISNCYSCHGTDGRSRGSIPSLAGKNAQQALLMLKKFKSGHLPSTVMTRHAKGYTDAELEALANYIGTNLK